MDVLYLYVTLLWCVYERLWKMFITTLYSFSFCHVENILLSSVQTRKTTRYKIRQQSSPPAAIRKKWIKLISLTCWRPPENKLALEHENIPMNTMQGREYSNAQWYLHNNSCIIGDGDSGTSGSQASPRSASLTTHYYTLAYTKVWYGVGLLGLGEWRGVVVCGCHRYTGIPVLCAVA